MMMMLHEGSCKIDPPRSSIAQWLFMQIPSTQSPVHFTIRSGEMTDNNLSCIYMGHLIFK